MRFVLRELAAFVDGTAATLPPPALALDAPAALLRADVVGTAGEWRNAPNADRRAVRVDGVSGVDRLFAF
jgi:hypothetical protein